MEEGKLLGIGNPLLDLTVYADATLLERYSLEDNNAILAEEIHKPLYDDLMDNFSVHFTAGGSVQNSLRVCQWILKQPRVTTYMGSVGTDRYSDILRDSAVADGVNVVYQYQKTQPTGTCAVIVTSHNGNKRSLCANLAAAEHFTIDHIKIPENRAYVDKADFYYISGFFITVSHDTMMEVAELAASKNKVFITNLSAPFICQFFNEPLMKVMPYVDIVFGNETESWAFAKEQKWETTDLKEIALKMTNLPKVNTLRKRIVIVTQGKDPVLMASDGVTREFPVKNIPKEDILDTNGAGDAFAGGFLSQLIQGKSLEVCIDCATWAARHVIQHSGCTFDPTVTYNQD